MVNDTYSIKRVHYFQDSVTGETPIELCDSDQFIYWYGWLFSSCTLGFSGGSCGKSKENTSFKDTKKVNALVFLYILTIVPYWFIIRTILILENAVLHIGHIFWSVQVNGPNHCCIERTVADLEF